MNQTIAKHPPTTKLYMPASVFAGNANCICCKSFIDYL